VSLVKDQAVVLRTYRLGEADRIVVLLTEGQGKRRAVAKGVRRTKSKFGARLEPMSHVHCVLWEGRSELGVVNQVEVTDSFRIVREDLARMEAALSILEVADHVAQERHADSRLYQMVVGALRTLNDPEVAPPLVAPAFFLKALVAEGAGPVVDRCASCGVDGPLVAFDYAEGGMLCPSCRRGRSVSPEGHALLVELLGGGLRAALRPPPPPGTAEVASIATEAIELHLDRRLRSLRSAVG